MAKFEARRWEDDSRTLLRRLPFEQQQAKAGNLHYININPTSAISPRLGLLAKSLSTIACSRVS